MEGKDAISISEQLIQLFRFFQVAMKSETGHSGDRKKQRIIGMQRNRMKLFLTQRRGEMPNTYLDTLNKDIPIL